MGRLCYVPFVDAFTGTDGESEGVHVFLISGASSDIDHFYSALNYRVQHLKQSQSTAAASDTAAAAITSKRKTSVEEEQVSFSNIP